MNPEGSPNPLNSASDVSMAYGTVSMGSRKAVLAIGSSENGPFKQGIELTFMIERCGR